MTTETPLSKCQNCDWSGPDADLGCRLEEVPDLLERVAPGEPMPTGECPECGALCQMVETEYEFTITIPVTAATPGEAAELALADLRDETMEWTDYTVRNTDTGEITATGLGVDRSGPSLHSTWKPGERVEHVSYPDGASSGRKALRPGVVVSVDGELCYYERLKVRFDDGEERYINPDVIRHQREETK